MDPDICLREIFSSLADGETEAAADLAADLLDWMKRGGFPPAIHVVVSRSWEFRLPEPVTKHLCGELKRLADALSDRGPETPYREGDAAECLVGGQTFAGHIESVDVAEQRVGFRSAESGAVLSLPFEAVRMIQPSDCRPAAPMPGRS